MNNPDYYFGDTLARYALTFKNRHAAVNGLDMQVLDSLIQNLQMAIQALKTEPCLENHENLVESEQQVRNLLHKMFDDAG